MQRMHKWRAERAGDAQRILDGDHLRNGLVKSAQIAAFVLISAKDRESRDALPEELLKQHPIVQRNGPGQFPLHVLADIRQGFQSPAIALPHPLHVPQS